MTPRRTRLALALVLFLGCASIAVPADVVVLKDGFVIQGDVRKETTSVVDKASGRSIPIVKADGLDLIDEGPKWTIFSTHAKQLGAISPDIKLRPEYRAYKMPFPGRKANNALTDIGETVKVSEFDSKWIRTIEAKSFIAANAKIDQQITYMDPYFIYMVSATHLWRLSFRTNEWDPKLVRKLLLMHPDLAEPDGKCDPLKRIALARFMLDAGWLQFAKDEMDRLKRDFTGTLSKDAQEVHDKITKDIDTVTADLVAREAEKALAAGRYKYAAEVLAIFPEKTADSKEVARAAKVGAELKTGQERHDTARRVLNGLVDDVGGKRPLNALVAVGGGLAQGAWKPEKAVTSQALELATAGAQVIEELHPDSAIRIETFVTLATQAERERAAGKEPTKKPDELVATAISGWAMGRNGATPNVESALKIWTARQLVLAFQRGESQASRNDALARYRKNANLDIPQLAQIISLLPPAEPEDLENRTGKPLSIGKSVPGGVYQRKSMPAPGHATGIDYIVKLPPEYHHGRAYPVLIVLTHAGVNPEDVLGPLMTESERNGYIVVAPEWTNQFGKGWQWNPDDHVYVTAVLRDAVRHFTVDNDRVFLCGVGEGANMAMDVGASHPDLFAGVIPMAPIPKWGSFFIETWRNAQKLPFYVVTGELAGQSLPNLRSIFERWTRNGFPAVMTIYKGRGIEWYASEATTIFDWMSRKTRVNGTATLALGANRQSWAMLREHDNRFYWLQADKVVVGKNGGAVVPALMQGDVRGNLIDLKCDKVKHLTVWLSADMIDWAKPVKVQINAAVPSAWPKAKVIAPSLDVLLEDYFERGDRRMLFLNKLELKTGP
ncbi:Uncharacterized protein OS=Planctomyces maris DSM 8797 GN=PM8797T_05990 PE=4 SV=1: Abhydrolase_6 [Gemmata massiliana]|uniref:Uncharacterized protein n=1 Tax=Gemmata massiliana TaxID=1210884 RepID=A0A6P2D1E3_9BACT|nr:alpha/beta hydrolase [Gemmata massiliana]VTR94943.1 Uncharacterized protein OS=Planctomyces maris DSM 8797 GN=PM8797T_05990 PE=4 SV=1: Abhydrolase_6 [Gemmata massiliana]